MRQETNNLGTHFKNIGFGKVTSNDRKENNMVRFVIGIILLSFSVLTLTGGPSKHMDGSLRLIMFLFYMIPGALLVYFGRRHLNRRKNILTSALTMLRESDYVDTEKISLDIGLDEIKVREFLVNAQSKGILPLHALSGRRVQVETSRQVAPEANEINESIVNTSGQGKLAIVPREIQKWNWGAFLLPPLWGIGNKTYIILLGFIPLVNFIMPFIGGAKGSEWAWQNKRWDDIVHFKRVQRLWMYWGIVVWVAMIIFSFFLESL